MKLILVALDGSQRAHEVFAATRLLAEKTRARLLLYRVITIPVGLPAEAYAFPPDTLEQMLRSEAERELDGFARQLPAELLAGVRVGIGAPWRAICDAAREAHADLIAVGSHGYGVLDRVLGTTAAKVVNHADRSVLVVRSEVLLER